MSKHVVEQRDDRCEPVEDESVREAKELILTPENLDVVAQWSRLIGDMYSILRQLHRNETQPDTDSLTGLNWYAKELLDCDPGEYDIIRNVKVDALPNVVEYFTLLKNFPETVELRDDNEANRWIFHAKNNLRVWWIDDNELRVFNAQDNKLKTAEAVCIDAGEFKYILAPQALMFGNVSFNVAVAKPHREAALVHLYEFLDKNNLSRNFIQVYSGNLWRMDQKIPKFKLPKGFAVFGNSIEKELKLLETIIGTQETRKVMFYGKPGTGKTTAVERLMQTALENGVQCIMVTDMNDLTSLYNNVPKPALIILEDFDMATQDRASTSSSRINSDILQALSEDVPGVITVATSNNCDGLDRAAIRAGRIDKAYYFDYPTAEVKRIIAERMCEKYRLTCDSHLVQFVIDNKYQMTGAIIEAVVKEKAMLDKLNMPTSFKEVTEDYVHHSLNPEFAIDKELEDQDKCESHK